ncbi:MAG: 16S rRNA (cytidine(1402)-2'-O)-methyltransferase [Alphaproteobacteria bacterium]
MINQIPNIKFPQIENALYVVATPIGNLADITLRALNILSSVDYIICEDTRISGILLHKFEIIKKKLLIYNDFSDNLCRNKILTMLIEGKSLALISDAGTPLISDPGYKLIKYLRQNCQKIIAIPGASSLTASISISGIACDNFLFLGFLSSAKNEKFNQLKSLSDNYSFIFFETSNRLKETLEIINELMPQRLICIAKELTKIYEEVFFDNASKLLEFFQENPDKIKGEFVVIVEKISKDQLKFDEKEVIKQIKILHKNGKSIKDISLEIAEIYGVNKKEIYKLALENC